MCGATREVAQRVDEVRVTQRALHDHTALRILLVHHRVSAALNLLRADADPAQRLGWQRTFGWTILVEIERSSVRGKGRVCGEINDRDRSAWLTHSRAHSLTQSFTHPPSVLRPAPHPPGRTRAALPPRRSRSRSSCRRRARSPCCSLARVTDRC